MRRWLRFGLIGVGALAALAVVAVAVFTLTFDPNSQKQRIVDAVRRATGRDFVLAGPLRLSFGLTPMLEADDAALSNRPGGSRPQMVSVARIEVNVALLPLLLGKLDIGSVVLDHPDILLETDSQGVGNWLNQRPPVPSAPSPQAGEGPAAGASSSERVVLHRLVVQNGLITWRNSATGRVTSIDLPDASLTIDGGAEHLVANVQTGGQPVHIDAVAARDHGGPWLVKLAATGAGAQLALDGAVAMPFSIESYRGRVDLAAADLSALDALLRVPGLPPLHDLRLGATLGPDLTLQDLSLRVGASSLATFLPGATMSQLVVTSPSLGQPAQLVAEGSLPGGAWRLASGVAVSRDAVALNGLALSMPGGDLTGDAAIIHAQRWLLRGSIEANRLDVDWLLNLRGASPNAAPATDAANPALATQPAPKRVFSDSPLPWDRLQAADAELGFRIGVLHVRGVDEGAVAGQLALHGGVLELAPLSIVAPEGRVDSSLTLDAGSLDPSVTLVLLSAGFPVDRVFRTLGLPGGSDALAELDVTFHSHGQSAHALATRVDGHAGLAIVDGALANGTLSAAFGDVLPSTYGRLDLSGRSVLRCLALRLDADDGHLNLSALKLDTTRLDLGGDGTVDLGGETIALRLRAAMRIGPASLIAPVKVEGALNHLRVSLDSPGAVGRPGIIIGAPTAPDDCIAALAMARGGRPGRLPMPVAEKTAKPAELLRSFLR